LRRDWSREWPGQAAKYAPFAGYVLRRYRAGVGLRNVCRAYLRCFLDNWWIAFLYIL